MPNKICNIINALKAQIVKYGSLKNLEAFNKKHPDAAKLLPKGAFTRNRKMPLSDLMSFMIWPRAESLSLELLNFSQLIHTKDVTKNDFSTRRKFIHYSYLKEMSSDIMSLRYDVTYNIDRWKGHLLLAADGTTYSIPATDKLKASFMEGRKVGCGDQPLARGIIIKDVLNGLIVASNMEGYGRDEIQLLQDELSTLPECIKRERPLLILDRKYCAYTLLSKLLSLGYDFIIRVKSRFNEEVDSFAASDKNEQIVTLHPASTTVKKIRRLYGAYAPTDNFKVKLVRLKTGIIVMTSLLSESVTDEAVSDLYHKRWDDETTIGFVKNNLQVEIFSGISVNSVEQDFYSKTISYNILSMLVAQAAEKRHERKPNLDRSTYKINWNIALGIFKIFMPKILHSKRDFNSMTDEMLTRMASYVTAVVPDRSNHRAFRKIKHSGKYITLTNYARAI